MVGFRPLMGGLFLRQQMRGSHYNVHVGLMPSSRRVSVSLRSQWPWTSSTAWPAAVSEPLGHSRLPCAPDRPVGGCVSSDICMEGSLPPSSPFSHVTFSLRLFGTTLHEATACFHHPQHPHHCCIFSTVKSASNIPYTPCNLSSVTHC